jgi:hypothetical protein
VTARRQQTAGYQQTCTNPFTKVVSTVFHKIFLNKFC